MLVEKIPNDLEITPRTDAEDPDNDTCMECGAAVPNLGFDWGPTLCGSCYMREMNDLVGV